MKNLLKTDSRSSPVPIFGITIFRTRIHNHRPLSLGLSHCHQQRHYGACSLSNNSDIRQNRIELRITGECPNVTVRYKQKSTFYNPKLDICPKTGKFLDFYKPKYPKNVWAFPVKQVMLQQTMNKEIRQKLVDTYTKEPSRFVLSNRSKIN